MPKKLAFRMKLIPGFEEEYERRHREIWPELVTLLKSTGIIDYQIFLDKETSTLFAFQVIAGNTNSQDLGSSEIVKRWWAHMADIMETNPDNSPVSKELSKVFDLENN
ncbi:L-rhamnose mutarotase [Algoriphagus sp.]|uniref:L-rhamnose mutarotase n=1 Tax=Algoriphagus sp. TaxID=1872435 RepID=UPI003280E38B